MPANTYKDHLCYSSVRCDNKSYGTANELPIATLINLYAAERMPAKNIHVAECCARWQTIVKRNAAQEKLMPGTKIACTGLTNISTLQWQGYTMTGF